MTENIYCRRRTEALFYVMLISILIFFLTVNFLTPPMGEDYVLVAFSPVESCGNMGVLLQEMANRIYQQMTGWNVRLGEQLSIVFSCLDRPVFGIFNSLIALYYLWLINQYAFLGKATIKERIWGLGIAFAVILLFQPALGEIFFWRTGSANYLWALCILLTFALPMRYYLSSNTKDVVSGSKLWPVLLTILGFFAGFTNENTVGTFVLLYAGVIVHHIAKRKKLPIWVYMSFCSLLAGFLFMLNAPSTSYRVAFYNQMFGIQNPDFAVYLGRIPTVVIRFWRDNRSLVVIAAGCVLIALLSQVKKRRQMPEVEKNILFHDLEPFWWLLLTALACGALILSPYIETRAFLLTDFMMVVCIVFYSRVFFVNFGKQLLTYTVVLALFVAALSCMSQIYKTYRSYDAFCSQRAAAALLSEKESFLWWEYPGICTSRILTTREDYLRDKQSSLSYYFGREIRVEPYYVRERDIGREMCTDCEAAWGGIDWVQYEPDVRRLSVSGWATLPDTDSEENEIYLCVSTGGERFCYKVVRVQRPDVAEALADKAHENSGYYGEVELPEMAVVAKEIEVGVYVVNREAKICGEIFKTVRLE